MLGHALRADRPAAAPARARGLRQGRRPRRRRQGRADHRRGEDQAGAAALLGVHGRGDAARGRRRLPRHRRGAARRRPRARPRLHRPAAARCAAGRRRCCSAPQTMREAIADLIPGANFISRPRLSKLTYAGREEDHAPAAAHGRGRLLGRRGLCHRRADPPPARRRGGGARRAVARARATPRWRSTSPATSTSWSPPTPSAWASTSTSTTSPSPASRKFDGQVPSRADAGRARRRSPAAPAAT